MNSAISISTQDLRVILQEARGKDMGLAVRAGMFPTELASQALLKSEDSDSVDAAGNGEDTENNAECRRDLAEIFLGGFMHDCGLWNEESGADESHEVSGANLISQISEISDFLPSLTQIVLFHSDAIRIATKPALVMIIDQPDDDRKRTFNSEFYRTLFTAPYLPHPRGDPHRGRNVGRKLHRPGPRRT